MALKNLQFYTGYGKTIIEEILDSKRSTNNGNDEACINGFRCHSDGTCISLEKRCNDVVRECPMNQDQLECGIYFSTNFSQ